MIGSKGVYVSGGESQRLAIARAFLKNAPILILDEATAFADPDNERLVQQAFETLSKDKTVIMIAHRLLQLPMQTASMFWQREKLQKAVRMNSSSKKTAFTSICGANTINQSTGRLERQVYPNVRKITT